MDFKISRPVKKLILSITLAIFIPLFVFWFYVDGQYHYLRAKLSLYSAGIETTELWQMSDGWSYCGRTKGGGWVLVLDVIYQGIVAEDGCIENLP